MRLPYLAGLMSSLMILAPSAAWSGAGGIDDQITDAVTESNVKVEGDAPAMSMGSFYDATSEALASGGNQTDE